MTGHDTTALITSELQLISLIEGFDLGVFASGTTAPSGGVDVLIAGRYRPEPPLKAELDRRGIRLGEYRPHRLLGLMRARQLAVGDLFGQAALAAIAWGDARRVVILEDGLATLTVMNHRLSAGSLTRPRLDRAPVVARLTSQRAAQRLQRLIDADSLHWVTSCASADLARQIGSGVNGRVHEHRFDVLRTMPRPTIESAATVRRLVVGSSYATNGLIDPDFYTAWLRDACRKAPAHTLFVPHPREDPTGAETAVASGARVYDTPASVEQIALQLPHMNEIACLPSSPVLTLRALGYGDALHVAQIPSDRWVSGTPQRFIDLVGLVAPSTTRIDPPVAAADSAMEL